MPTSVFRLASLKRCCCRCLLFVQCFVSAAGRSCSQTAGFKAISLEWCTCYRVFVTLLSCFPAWSTGYATKFLETWVLTTIPWPAVTITGLLRLYFLEQVYILYTPASISCVCASFFSLYRLELPVWSIFSSLNYLAWHNWKMSSVLEFFLYPGYGRRWNL